MSLYADADRAAIGAGFDSVAVEGRVTVSKRRDLGAMPLAENATIQVDGARLELLDVARSADTVSVSLNIFAVDGSDGPAVALASNVPDLTLVNATRGETLAFHAVNARAQGGVLVLPGNEVYSSSAAYTTASRVPGERAFPVDDAWIGGAHVVVSRWVQADSYPVRAKVAVAP